jgi:hypothetical protein
VAALKEHVRFTPNSDHNSGLAQNAMAALGLKADIGGALADVRFGPRADIPIFISITSTAIERTPDYTAG